MADSAHTCHWPDCSKPVPPAMWGCRTHWFALPKHLRDRIWKTYKPGQEIAKTPSPEYIAAANAVQDWIATQLNGKAMADGRTHDEFPEHQHCGW